MNLLVLVSCLLSFFAMLLVVSAIYTMFNTSVNFVTKFALASVVGMLTTSIFFGMFSVINISKNIDASNEFELQWMIGLMSLLLFTVLGLNGEK